MRLQPGILRHLLGPQAGADLELARGTVKELRLSIPWARILAQAQPVLQATLRTVEVVVVRRRKGAGEGQGAADVEGPREQLPPQPQPAVEGPAVGAGAKNEVGCWFLG